MVYFSDEFSISISISQCLKLPRPVILVWRYPSQSRSVQQRRLRSREAAAHAPRSDSLRFASRSACPASRSIPRHSNRVSTSGWSKSVSQTTSCARFAAACYAGLRRSMPAGTSSVRAGSSSTSSSAARLNRTGHWLRRCRARPA